MTNGKAVRAFTLIEILISILILALGVLGLGALFPVIIREQRIGADAVTGVVVSNNARAMLGGANYGSALVGIGNNLHPYQGSTAFLWQALRDNQQFDFPNANYPLREGLGNQYDPTNFTSLTLHKYAQGEWYVCTVDPDTGAAIIGQGYLPDPWLGFTPTGTVKVTNRPGAHVSWVAIPVSQRLYPQTLGVEPQFVWDFAIQRVSDFKFPYTDSAGGTHSSSPYSDPLRAVLFVRRIDPRIRVEGPLLEAFSASPPTALPVAEALSISDSLTATPALDGIGTGGSPRYSTIKTCEVEFWFDPSNTAYNRRDRLYFPNLQVRSVGPQDMKTRLAVMKQPGQKLVDNLGNIYTVIGSGNEPNVAAMDIDGLPGADYLRIDPPVPESVTRERAAPATQQTNYVSSDTGNIPRAIWQVAYTPQIPVSVTLVEIERGTR